MKQIRLLSTQRGDPDELVGDWEIEWDSKYPPDAVLHAGKVYRTEEAVDEHGESTDRRRDRIHIYRPVTWVNLD